VRLGLGWWTARILSEGRSGPCSGGAIREPFARQRLGANPADMTPAVMLDALRQVSLHYFPQLAPDAATVAT